MKIGERTLHNALFSAASSLLPLGLSFIFWPYIVGSLGESSYGIFAMVGSIVGYFALLDLGLGNAVVKYVSEYTGSQNEEGVRKVVGSALFMFVVAGIIGMTSIFFLARVLAVDLLKIPLELVDQAHRAFCVAGLGFFFSMMLTLMVSIVNGMNRYDISSMTVAVLGAVSTVGAVILIRMGGGLLALVWLNVVVPALTVLFLIGVVRHLLPMIPLSCALSPGMAKRILHFGMYSILGRITDVVIRQLAPLIIGMLLGMAAVAHYIIPFMMLSRLMSLLGRIGMVIFPTISELQGQERLDRMRYYYLTCYRMMAALALALTVPLLVFGPRFLSLWMSESFGEKGGTVFLFLCVGVLFDLFTHVPSYVVNGLGQPKVAGVAAVLNALLFLCLMIMGALFYDVGGVAAAYAISQMIVAPCFVGYVTLKVVKVPLGQLWREVLARPVLAAVVLGSVLLQIPPNAISSLYMLLSVMGLSVCCYMLLGICFGVFRAHERQTVYQYLGRITSRFRLRRAL